MRLTRPGARNSRGEEAKRCEKLFSSSFAGSVPFPRPLKFCMARLSCFGEPGKRRAGPQCPVNGNRNNAPAHKGETGGCGREGAPTAGPYPRGLKRPRTRPNSHPTDLTQKREAAARTTEAERQGQL